MIRRTLLAALTAGVAVGAAGCRNSRCCPDNNAVRPQPFLPAGPGAPPGGVIGPPSGGTTIPPASVPTSPVVPPVGPPGSAMGSLPPPDPLFGPSPGGSAFRPSPAPPAGSLPPRGSLPPAPRPTPGSGNPPPELLLPENPPGTPGSSSAKTPGADPTRGVLGTPSGPAKAPTAEPPVSRPSPTAAGLPGFTLIKEGVATGRKPALDGFDALQRGGYKTVVYLHGAGADVGKARDVAQTRGLAFEAVETTPQTLADALKRVTELAGDRGSKPVYVYDDDGVRAGAVWYLYLKTVDQQGDDVARIRARGIGLTSGTEADRDFWVAIQQYLAGR